MPEAAREGNRGHMRLYGKAQRGSGALPDSAPGHWERRHPELARAARRGESYHMRRGVLYDGDDEGWPSKPYMGEEFLLYRLADYTPRKEEAQD